MRKFEFNLSKCIKALINNFPSKSIICFIVLCVYTIFNFLINPHLVFGETEEIHLLNVSYDPTRELYQDFNVAFASFWKAKTGQTIKVSQSHGGSGKQARAVIDGLEADVLTLALGYDIDIVAEKGQLLSVDWQKKFSNNSAPYTSTIVFLVRLNNPKKILDWDDLARDGVEVVTPNPKTSGGARWNYLAMYAYSLKKFNNDDNKATEFVTQVYRNVPVMDTGARGSAMTFIERRIGDVLVTWEQEAYLAIKEFGKDKFEIIMPSMSIVAEPSVAVVEVNAKKHGTLEVAQAYLEYWYSDVGQEIVVKHYFRPCNKTILQKNSSVFKNIEMLRLEEVFENWKVAQKKHFDDGGIFDSIYE